MFKSLLLGITLTLAGNPLLAQGPLPRPCLHGDLESNADRTRRMQAIDYVTKVNIAESARLPALPRTYRPLEELGNIPPVPAGFAVQFHNNDRSYTIALKDTRDACHYAVFSDQDRLVYEGVPRSDPGGIVPLGTR
jgi:hypothetical protein